MAHRPRTSTAARRARKAAFLDRDGVLNHRPAEHHYVCAPEAFRWLPGARRAIVRLRALGYRVIVVSNQRGVARGLLTHDTLRAIEWRMQRDLRRHGTAIDAFYYCVHAMADACRCRKPAPGLILDAAAQHRIDLASSVVIGDAETDVVAGLAAGCRTIRIAPPAESSRAGAVAGDLPAAVELLAAGGGAGWPALPGATYRHAAHPNDEQHAASEAPWARRT